MLNRKLAEHYGECKCCFTLTRNTTKLVHSKRFSFSNIYETISLNLFKLYALSRKLTDIFKYHHTLFVHFNLLLRCGVAHFKENMTNVQEEFLTILPETAQALVKTP
jgi:hypothetical protein